MKVFDRFSGKLVDLPQQVQSGRYQLQRKVKLNNDIFLEPDDVLFSDGGQLLQLDIPFSGTFLNGFQNETSETIANLRQRAISTIALKINDFPVSQISPLLPSELADVSILLRLDELLSEILDRGHLHEIGRRPRMNLRYEARLTQLSRAKKIAGNAVAVLATRSADWQKRTISGVVPKNILALFSDDDLLLYENKVYVRLLDKLARHLRKRIIEVGQLRLQYEKAIELNDAESLHHSLRTELCDLWGNSSKQDQSLEIMMDANKTVFAKLKALLVQVNMLRESNLYREIPRNAQVSEQIRSTNILCHDQHYRHLRTLWLEYQKTRIDTDNSPENLFALEKSAHLDYVMYIGLIIRRVFDDMAVVNKDKEDLYKFANQELVLKFEHDCWHICFDQRQLVFVPSLHAVEPVGILNNELEIRIPVYCHGEEVIESVEKYLEINPTKDRWYINPMGFYGEEKIRSLIDIWLWKPLFDGYAKPIKKLPTPLVDWLKHKDIAEIHGNEARFCKPLNLEAETATIEYLAKAPVNDETEKQILQKIRHLATLGVCRICAKPAKLSPTGVGSLSGGFHASCSSCDSEWMLLHESSRRTARYTLKSNSDVGLGFSNRGRWCINIS